MAEYPGVPFSVASHVCGKHPVHSDSRPQSSGTSRGSSTSEYQLQVARRAGQTFGPRAELQEWLSMQVSWMLLRQRTCLPTTLAEYIASECDEVGNTLNFYLLYENRASTRLVVCADLFDTSWLIRRYSRQSPSISRCVPSRSFPLSDVMCAANPGNSCDAVLFVCKR